MERDVFPTLIANEHLRSIVGGDLLAGRLGHAYILEGPKGCGKHTAAKLISAAISCERKNEVSAPLPCGKCLACRKIMGGFSPDFLIVKREDDRATIGVESVRKLREELWIAPNENEVKVYLIEDADTMTVQAQNAFLLSLEEPPPFALFFLLTQSAGALLETIRSRAPILRMQIFDSETLSDILAQESRFDTLRREQPQFFQNAITAADGAIGRAHEILLHASEETEMLLALRSDAEKLASLLFCASPGESTQALLSVPKDRTEALKLLDYLLLALRDLAVTKRNAALPPLLYPTMQQCRAAAEKLTLSRLLAAYNDVTAAKDAVLANTSVQTVFTGLLMNKH